MNYLAENTFLTKENYEERLNEIKSWFDTEAKTGDYDALSNIEELKLLCEAKDAYIRHLEAPVISTNTQYVVEYIGVKDDRKFYKSRYYKTEAEALAVFDALSLENPYISYMKVFDLNNKILKEMDEIAKG